MHRLLSTLQSRHFDPQPSRGSPYHSLNPDAHPRACWLGFESVLPPKASFAMPLLFSYGTLQQENVQLSTFGRLLQGQRDELLEFERSLVRIAASRGYKR